MKSFTLTKPPAQIQVQLTDDRQYFLDIHDDRVLLNSLVKITVTKRKRPTWRQRFNKLLGSFAIIG